MKLRSIIALFLALILVSSFTWSAYAEQAQDEVQIHPHIIYTISTSEGISGIVDLPEDGNAYFVRITFFLPYNTFFVVILPIVDGEFDLRICCSAEYISMQLVDEPDAFLPGTYTVYDSLGYPTGRASEHPPDARG